jgi:hypothetical protein
MQLIFIRLPRYLSKEFHLKISNLQNRFPKIIPLQHPDQPIPRILNPLRNAHLHVNLAIFNPPLHILPMLFPILGSHIGVEDEEAPDGEALGHYDRHVLDAVGFGGEFGGLGH